MAEFLAVAVILLLGMGAYWSMVVFPRQRDFQQRQRVARSLAAGDEVVTFGGVIGKVQRIDGAMGVAYVEIAEGVQIRLVTAAIVQRYNPEEIARHARQGQDDAPGEPAGQ
ncbi:MAG: preprotein translocase subunit YajC [Anaerolineae bacterium]|jgi:preprotein translocase subunit YajC|nr:preprotein translocase subunit YajC [Anaerolineae bacterium]